MPAASEIVVVSGLPRSGTSLAMQMLAAGGVEPVTDRQRQADDDNPRGYYEYEPVKRLRDEAGWLAAARGKCVKVISQLLFDLPASESYRVILMTRDLDECLASQETMIARRGGTAAPRAAMKSAFASHLANVRAWLAGQPNMRVLEVDYAATVADPRAASRKMSEFLDRALDAAAMAAAVDAALYRNRG